jgi:hypothetical protein
MAYSLIHLGSRIRVQEANYNPLIWRCDSTRVENEVLINVPIQTPPSCVILLYTAAWQAPGTNLVIASDFHGSPCRMFVLALPASTVPIS